jgi:hypothetical protein
VARGWHGHVTPFEVTQHLEPKEAVMSTSTTPSPIRRMRTFALLLLAVGAMTGPAFLAAGPASAAEKAPPTPIVGAGPIKNSAPAPTECHVIDFRTATVDPLVSADPSTTKHQLTVTGLLREPADVTLVPLTYIRQPEHWGIEVTACTTAKTSSADEPVMPPFRLYKATFTFQGTLGSCGIDVIGATTHQTFDLAAPPGCEAIGPRI